MENLTIKRVINQIELEECLKIRMQVFVKEQNIPIEIEIDKYDSLCNEESIHYIFYLNEKPVGTFRAINYNKYLKIGRVAIISDLRGQKLGLKMLTYGIDEIQKRNLFNIQEKYFYLEAQKNAVSFYKNLDFEEEGVEFLSAGIKHQKMTRKIK